jgi:hypothetical protein
MIKSGYASCIKKDWWKFWKGTEDVDCVKIKASDYPGTDLITALRKTGILQIMPRLGFLQQK